MSEEVKKTETKTQRENEKKADTAAQTKSSSEKKTVIYIGPSVPHVAESGTVYNNGIPEALKELTKKSPFFEKLIVPVEELREAKNELSKEQTPLYVCYKEALSIVKKAKEV